MKYLLLGLAIIFEVIGSSFMKLSVGFSKLIPTVITIVAYLVSFYFFSQTLKVFSLGIAYAIWAGLGIVLTALVSIFIFKQNLDWPAILGIIMIVGGVLVMNIFSKTSIQ